MAWEGLIRRQSLCFFSITDKQEHGCSCCNIPKLGTFTNSLKGRVLYTVILRSPVLWSPPYRQLEVCSDQRETITGVLGDEAGRTEKSRVTSVQWLNRKRWLPESHREHRQAHPKKI